VKQKEIKTIANNLKKVDSYWRDKPMSEVLKSAKRIWEQGKFHDKYGHRKL